MDIDGGVDFNSRIALINFSIDQRTCSKDSRHSSFRCISSYASALDVSARLKFSRCSALYDLNISSHVGRQVLELHEPERNSISPEEHGPVAGIRKVVELLFGSLLSALGV